MTHCLHIISTTWSPLVPYALLSCVYCAYLASNFSNLGKMRRSLIRYAFAVLSLPCVCVRVCVCARVCVCVCVYVSLIRSSINLCVCFVFVLEANQTKPNDDRALIREH